MSREYWVACPNDPVALFEAELVLDAESETEADETSSEILVLLRALRKHRTTVYKTATFTIVDRAPAFVPTAAFLVHASMPPNADGDDSDWDRVSNVLIALSSAGEGVFITQDGKILMDDRG